MKRAQLALATALAAMLGLHALAWNPLLLRSGSPARWDTASAVIWNPDGGGLGCDTQVPEVCSLSNTQANQLVADEVVKWQNVTTATIAYAQGGQIIDPGTGSPTDVTSANYSQVINEDNGQNPIIYDNNRDIFDLLGTPSGVVGFAGILRTSGTQITKGFAVLQGDWIDGEPSGTMPSDPGEVSENEFRGMIVHELGHINNLAHTSVNHEVSALPGCAAPPVASIETMSPFLTADAVNLANDDVVGISELYPAAGWDTSFAFIRGALRNRDGTDISVGNVVLRPDTTDCNRLYDEAQAMQPGSNPNEAGGASAYEFSGLDPSTGYTVRVTTINDGGSYRVTGGPLGAPDDAYNGANEDWFNPPDDPTAVSVVTTGAAGTTVGGIDIRLNNAGSPGEVEDTLILDKLTDPLPPALQQIDDGFVNSASGLGGTDQAAWINRFTPDAGDLPLDVTRIDIMTWQSSVQVGRAIRLLVYLDPAATGNPANATLQYTEDVTIQVVSSSQFNEHTLAAPVRVTGGEYYVGAFDLVADPDTTFIKSSDTDTLSGRSWDQVNGTTPGGYSNVTDLTWMVRAWTSSVPPDGSVRLTWGDACNIGTVPDQRYAVYQGNMSSFPTGLDHAPIACAQSPLEFNVRGAADDQFWLVAPELANREGSLGDGTGGSSRDPAGAPCQTINPDPCP